MAAQSSTHSFGGTARFSVVRKLGAGGMGVVYEALDRETGGRIALKTLQDAGGAEELFRLKNEFRSLQDLHHPNLIRYGDLVEEEGTWFFTMELVGGVDFLAHVRAEPAKAAPTPSVLYGDTVQGGDAFNANAATVQAQAAAAPSSSFDEERLRAALVELVRGLSVLHASGRVHRDVKPGNVLVEAGTSRVVLLDLGLVTGPGMGIAATAQGIVGTVAYMSPEQAASKPVGPATDLYAVGVMLYEALTGRLPHDGAPLEVLLAKQGEPPPPSALLPDVPADLDELCRLLLRVDPASRPTGAAVLARLGEAPSRAIAERTDALPFVGRQDELATLTKAFTEARDAGAVLVLVEGESGVGKSMLVGRFVEALAARDSSLVVLAGRCYERESVPFKAVDGVVDALSRYMSRLTPADASALLPRDAALIGQVFPVMRRVRAVAEAPERALGLDSHELRSRTFAALRELLGRLSDRHPLLVCVDDLQWADLDSLRVYAELLRQPDAPRLLIIGTERPEADTATKLSADGLRGRDVRKVILPRLSPDDGCALAAALLARAGDTRTEAASIAAEADGHPLFIDELVRHAKARGPDDAPLRLDDALRARISALPEAARRVMEVVAVAGARRAQEVVLRASELALPDFAEAMTVLRAGNLVRSQGPRRSDAVEPYHDRVRESVVTALSEEALRSLHRALAVSLEADERPDIEALAVHWSGAGEATKSAAYAERAGDEAVTELAFAHAAERYKDALRLQGDAAPPGLGRKLADACASAGRSSEAGDAYLALIPGASDAEAVNAQRLACQEFLKCGRFDQSMVLVRRVMRRFGVRVPATARGALVSFLWRSLWLRLRGYRFVRREAAAVPPAELARVDLGWALHEGLTAVSAILGADMTVRTLGWALRAGEPARVARSLATDAAWAAGVGDERKFVRALEEAMALARETDDVQALQWCAFSECAGNMMLGHFRRALAPFESVEKIARERPRSDYVCLMMTHLYGGVALYWLGDLGAVDRAASLGRADALGRDDLVGIVVHSSGLAFISGWLRRDEEGRGEFDELRRRWGRSTFDTQGAYILFGESAGHLYAGALGEAYQAVNALVRDAKRALYFRVAWVRILFTDQRARCALALAGAATGAERKRLLSIAAGDARRLARERQPYAPALAALIRSGIAAVRGDSDTSVVELRAAIAMLDAAEIAMVAAAARRRLGQVVGGDEGRALVEEGTAFMLAQEVKRPDKLTAMFAPGFPAE